RRPWKDTSRRGATARSSKRRSRSRYSPRGGGATARCCGRARPSPGNRRVCAWDQRASSSRKERACVTETMWLVQGVERWPQGGWTSYWLGPQQWLVTHPEKRADYEQQRDALIAAGGALFDVSEARSVIHADSE